MIYRSVRAMHSYFGIRSLPTDQEMVMMTHVLLAAIEQSYPKNEDEMEDALDYNRRNNP